MRVDSIQRLTDYFLMRAACVILLRPQSTNSYKNRATRAVGPQDADCVAGDRSANKLVQVGFVECSHLKIGRNNLFALKKDFRVCILTTSFNFDYTRKKVFYVYRSPLTDPSEFLFFGRRPAGASCVFARDDDFVSIAHKLGVVGVALDEARFCRVRLRTLQRDCRLFRARRYLQAAYFMRAISRAAQTPIFGAPRLPPSRSS